MFLFARRNLLREKGRLIASLLGIGLSIVLILLLEGFRTGLYRQATAYYDNSGADLFVAQSGVDSMLSSSASFLPEAVEEALKDFPEVAGAQPIITAPLVFQRGHGRTPVYVIGYEPGKPGAPWKISQGRGVEREGEVVLDKSLAQRNGVKIGDTVEIAGESLPVVGLSAETSSWLRPYVFISREEAQRLFSAPGMVSFLLVSLKEGVSPGEMKEKIERDLPGVAALTIEAMSRNDRTLLSDNIGTPVSVMTGIAFAVGVMVVGLTVYTAVLSRWREYGVLKAVGAGGNWLYGTVFFQALGSSTMGFVVGSLLSLGLMEFIEWIFPQFMLVTDTAALVKAFLASVLMGLAASYLPLRRVSQVDPLLVFRS